MLTLFKLHDIENVFEKCLFNGPVFVSPYPFEREKA